MKKSAPLVSESIEQMGRDLAFARHRLHEVEIQIGEMSRGGEPFLARLVEERDLLRQEVSALMRYLRGEECQ